jgi:lipoprotein-releasing system permease protein
VNVPLWVAVRYLRSGRRSTFVTLLSAISVGGVALGVAALVTVLAVMNGFENEIQTRIAGTDAHVVILGSTSSGITHRDELIARLRRDPDVIGLAPFTYVKAMAFREGYTEGLIVKGVDLAAERSVTTVGRNLRPPLDSIPTRTQGGRPGIVLGSELAAHLDADVGDEVLLTTLTGDPGSALGFATRLKAFRLVGVFQSGLYTYDSSLGFTSITTAQEFFGLGDAVTGIEVRLRDMFDAPAVGARLVAASGVKGLRANNWIELNRNLFTWMKLEKTVMFVILTLIVLVAAFNIVSTLFMVVLEKRRDIGVLKSLGAGEGVVLKVFLYQGVLIGALGAGLGLGLGGLLIAVLQRYPFVKLPGDVYFIERLPVRPEMGDFLAVILATFALCLVAALYPAWRASRLDPVEAIRRTA